MAGPRGEDQARHASRTEPARFKSSASPLRAAVQRLNLAGVFSVGLVAVLFGAALLAGYFAFQPKPRIEAQRKPPPAASAPWRSIGQRLQQVEQGQFLRDEGILTFSHSLEASDQEILSVIGTYELPSTAAAQIESAESWGVTGPNRDELVMYVRNFLNTPITAMILRISAGPCASLGPQSTTVWASAYWGNPLRVGKEAVFHASLPAPYTLPSYCAVVTKVYSSRDQ